MSGEGACLAMGRSDAEDRARAFGRKLYRWRNDVVGLNIRLAAMRLGVSVELFTAWEHGRTDPVEIGPSTALRILQGTGLSAEELGLAPATNSALAAGHQSPGTAAKAGAVSLAAPAASSRGTLASGQIAPIVALGPLATRTVTLRVKRVFEEIATALTIEEAVELGQRLIAHARLAAE